MSQKKGADRLIVAGNLLDHHQQLLDQREHQARLGTHDDRAGDQLGTVQLLEDLGGHLRSGWYACPLRNVAVMLFQRSGLRGLGRGIRLQKHEGGALLQLGKQVQGRRIVLLEASRQLVHQARLRLDQRILIAGERFQLGHGGDYPAPVGAVPPGQGDPVLASKCASIRSVLAPAALRN